MIEREGELGGRRIEAGETFRFRCAPDLACFNTCCRDKRLSLYPYDLLRLRRALGRPSPEVLAEHVELELDPASGWPAPRLRLRADGRCPFVEKAGCAVYEHRPTCCRIFPLARAVAPAARPGAAPRQIFVASEPAGCLGWQQDELMTLERWIEDQGLEPFHRANNRAVELFMHPRRRRPMNLSERQLHGVVLALYNLDVFRGAVSQPGFAARFGLPRAAVERAPGDDEALLELGLSWLTGQFFGAR